MAITRRGRRERYDNIAQGSSGVAGPERTIAGDTVSKVEIYGGGYMTSTSTGDAWTNNVKAGASTTDNVSPDAIRERLIVGVSTSDQVENVKAGG